MLSPTPALRDTPRRVRARTAPALVATLLALGLSGCEIGRQAPETPRHAATGPVTGSATTATSTRTGSSTSPTSDGSAPTTTSTSLPSDTPTSDDGSSTADGRESASPGQTPQAPVEAPAPTAFTAQWVPTGTVRGVAATHLGWRDDRLRYTPGADAQTCAALAARSAVDPVACEAGGRATAAAWSPKVTGSVAVMTENGTVGRVTAPGWALFRLCATDPSEEEAVVAFLLNAPELTLPDGVIGLYGCHDLALVDEAGGRITEVHTLPASTGDAVVPGGVEQRQ